MNNIHDFKDEEDSIQNTKNNLNDVEFSNLVSNMLNLGRLWNDTEQLLEKNNIIKQREIFYQTFGNMISSKQNNKMNKNLSVTKLLKNNFIYHKYKNQLYKEKEINEEENPNYISKKRNRNLAIIKANTSNLNENKSRNINRNLKEKLNEIIIEKNKKNKKKK